MLTKEKQTGIRTIHFVLCKFFFTISRFELSSRHDVSPTRNQSGPVMTFRAARRRWVAAKNIETCAVSTRYEHFASTALTFSRPARFDELIHSRAVYTRHFYITVFASLFLRTHAKTVGDTCVRCIHLLKCQRHVARSRCLDSVLLRDFRAGKLSWCHLRLCARPRACTVVALTTPPLHCQWSLFFFFNGLSTCSCRPMCVHLSLRDSDCITSCEIPLPGKPALCYIIRIHRFE